MESSAFAVGAYVTYYGLAETLTVGEHVITITTCSQNGLQCYVREVAYAMTESSDPYDPAIESTWGDRNVPEGDPVYVTVKPVNVQTAEQSDTASGTDPVEPDTTAPETETTAPDAETKVGLPTGAIICIAAAAVAVIAVIAVALGKKKKK